MPLWDVCYQLTHTGCEFEWLYDLGVILWVEYDKHYDLLEDDKPCLGVIW